MYSLKGKRRALLFALCLIAILSVAVLASAEEPTEADPKPTESTQSDAAHNPEPTEAAAPDEPEQTPEPEQVPEPVNHPGDTAHEQAAEPDEEEQAPDEPESLPEDPVYAVSWASGAFGGQTVNYQNELIIGAGNSCVIDPVHDIDITKNGKALKKRKKVNVSYQSSNEKFVTASRGGRISGVKRGTAQVQVTVTLPDGSEKQLRQDVRVVDAPTIMFVPCYAVMENGAKLNLSQFAAVPLLQVSPNVDAGVTYSVAPKGDVHGSKVALSKETGELTVKYDVPGDVYIVTATTYGGATAEFTLYLGQRAQQIAITAPSNYVQLDGTIAVQAGGTMQLAAVIYSGDGQLAGRQDVDWAIASGADVASIDKNGLVTASAKVSSPHHAVVTAYANDGSEQSAQLTIMILP